MEANDTIITPSEVLEVTPRAQGGDAQLIKPLIPLKEEGLFRVWLGEQFYLDLLEDLNDYSTEYVHFQEGANYSTDDVVLFNNKLFVALADTTGEKPTDQSKWKVAPKFADETYEFFWQRYLKTVLAWHIFHSGVVYNAIRVTELAVVRPGTEERGGNRSASVKELSAFKHEISEDLNDFLQTMDRYLKKNNTKFPNYLPNKAAKDTPQSYIGRPRPNFGFSI